jgi:hypothetical protein
MQSEKNNVFFLCIFNIDLKRRSTKSERDKRHMNIMSQALSEGVKKGGLFNISRKKDTTAPKGVLLNIFAFTITNAEIYTRTGLLYVCLSFCYEAFQPKMQC